MASVESRIVLRLAKHASERLCVLVMGDLRAIKAVLSGSDSGLKNAWEELCVQAQDDSSFYWDCYLDTVHRSIAYHVARLPDYWREAIWLQTAAGEDWSFERQLDGEGGPPRDRTTAPVEAPDIARYICDKYVLPAAAKWSNRRIRRFIEVRQDEGRWEIFPEPEQEGHCEGEDPLRLPIRPKKIRAR